MPRMQISTHVARCALWVVVVGILGPARDVTAQADPHGAPFTFERSIVIEGVPWGPYSDYLATDVPGARVFATPQAAHAVAVLDVRAGKLVTLVKGIGNPHGVFYSTDAKRLFVADGEAGAVKVFDGDDFRLLKTIPVAVGANGATYEPATHLLYVNNGGRDAGLDHSFVSAIDTQSSEKVADIRIDGLFLEASVIDPATRRMYLDVEDKNSIAILDLKTREVIGNWPIRHSHHNMPMAFDADHKRLYVGCRDADMHGSIAIVELSSGKEIDTLPIGGWVDSIYYDAKRQRIYSSVGVGHLETYQWLSSGKYQKLDLMDTAVMAKTSIYSPDLDRMFVSVPHLGSTPAQILEFKPNP
jgi:DNA-binding beta-propeller fold protein YncE